MIEGLPFLVPCKCGGEPHIEYYSDSVRIWCKRCGKKCGCSYDKDIDNLALQSQLAYEQLAEFWNSEMSEKVTI